MSRIASEMKYAGLRRIAYEETVKKTGIPFLKLTDINEQALSEHEKWPDIGRQPPNGGWNWRSFMAKYKKETSRFEAAIWHKEQLCGLGAGSTSKSKIFLKIELIERTTVTPNPLRGNVVPVLLTCAEIYGNGIGVEEIRIMEPAAPRLVAYYHSFGYTYVAATKREPDYLFKKIKA